MLPIPSFHLVPSLQKVLYPDSCVGTVDKGGLTQVPRRRPDRKWLRLDPEGASRQIPGAPPGGGHTAHTFTGQSVGRDPRQGLAAHVAVGGPCMRAGVPVVRPWEVVHAVLGGLQ